MACIIVPTAEAIATAVIAKSEEKREQNLSIEHGNTATETKIPFSRKLRWLSRLLIGGSVLLAFEHIWHGEIVPWFPFLTAASNPADMALMLREMATVGVTMAIITTVVWAIMCVAADAIVRRDAHNVLKGNGDIE